MSIPIYQVEKECGLEENIAKSRTISYTSQIEKFTYNKDISDRLKAVASSGEYCVELDGLYPVRSILVSTVWNLNDDIFDRKEVWMARKTPEDKPSNLNHDEKLIVGHITGNWAVNNIGELISDETMVDDLPEVYHIFNTAVIYAKFSDLEMRERASKLIAEIEAGTKYVSMECHFRNFDYAIKKPHGEMVVLERNESTAFLTKYLRSYGGAGSYQDHKIGRCLRNITFSGKGYVDTPANPQSVIFSKESSFDFISKSFINDLKQCVGVCIEQKPNNGENETMSKELEDKVAELSAALETVKAEKASADELLASKLADLTKALESIAQLEVRVNELTEQNSALSSECEKYKLDQVKANRVNTLVSGGYDNDVAVDKVGKFINLNDEQFAVVANELVEARKVLTATVVVPEVPVVAPVVANVLETVVPEQVVNPVVDVSTASTRQSLVNLLEKINPSKKTNKESK